MAQKIKLSRWLKRTFKVFLWLVVSIVFLIGLAWLLLQTPYVQNYLTAKALTWTSEKTNHEIQIENIRISWFDNVELRGFLLKDYSGDSLASAKSMFIDYNLRKLIKSEILEIEEIHIEGGNFKLVKYSDSTELNLNVFLVSLKELNKKTSDTTKTTKPIYLDRVILEDFKFEMIDDTKEEELERIDFSHLGLNIRLAEITSIQVKKDSIAFNLEKFIAKDKWDRVSFKQFTTNVGFTDKYLVFSKLDVDTEHSHFGDSIHLSYQHPSALSSFSDSVDIYFQSENIQVHPNDAKMLFGLADLNKHLNTSFILQGKVNDLKLTDFRLAFGSSRILSSMQVIGLPKISETFLDINLDNTRLYAKDLNRLYGNQRLEIPGVDYMDINGGFSGFISNFSTKATVSTNLGKVKADMNVTVPKKREQTSYTGHLELIGFNLGPLIGDTALVQQVSMKGRVLGRGIAKENATFLVDLTGTDMSIKDYSYDSLAFKGYLAAKHFYGHFGIVDPNCKISGRTNVDLRKSPEKLSLTAKVDTLFTKKLNLSSDDYFVRTKIDWKQTHLKTDSLVGRLKLSDFNLRGDTTQNLILSEVDIETSLDSLSRLVTIMMPGIEADLKGDYTFNGLAAFFRKELADISGYFELSEDSAQFDVVPLKAELKAKFTDVNPYINFYNPAIAISNDATLEMIFEQKKNSDAIVSVYSSIDSVKFEDAYFLNNELDLYASLDPLSDEILGSFLFSSSNQHWKTVPPTELLFAEGVWSDNRIDLTSSIRQPDTDTKVAVNSEISLSTNSIKIRLKESDLIALGTKWDFNPDNRIWITAEGINIEGLDIRSGDKLASIGGILAKELNTSLNLVSRNIDLMQFNTVLGLPIEGFFDADFTFFRPPKEPFQFEGNFNLEDFMYKDVFVGNINGTSYWDDTVDGIRARVSVDRENFRTIAVDGYYYPLKEEQLNFKISFDQADFKMLEAFTADNLSEVKGAASGQVTLKGTGQKPVVTGYCKISEGAFKVDYLQTNYDFGGEIRFKKNKINFKEFILRDSDGDSAIFSGNVTHEYFDKIAADLKVRAKEFSFLNTSFTDNDLYYGSAVASGDIFITGPLNDLVLKVNAKTEKGTRFFIPLSDSETYEQAEFISFVDLSDTTKSVEDAINAVKQSLGLTIDFDLEVTPDAYVELIFDIKTGDIIRGRGNGNLKLKLDKNGNFELYGPLTITEGAYNFTVPNFINKEFQVKPGGTIVWYGDPYTGSMDLTATYQQKASFGDLLPPTDEQDGSMTQKFPVIVVLELQGDMLAPNIGFDITLDESVSFAQNQEVTKLITQIRNDEQQLKRQVVSLLFFKRFSPLQSSFVGGGGGGGSIGKSLSEFLTNQISYLATQLDENLEVEVNLTDMDQEGFNTFQLRLAYTFMDGRLKVTRGGDFHSATTENQNLVNDIIGDWSVEYMLTDDGKLRAKMFSQANQNILSNESQQNMETGLSLRYIKSFNTFKEILSKARSEAIQRKEEESMSDDQSGTN